MTVWLDILVVAALIVVEAIFVATEISLASSAQVAGLLIPLVAIASWVIDPLALSFRPIELGALVGGRQGSGLLAEEVEAADHLAPPPAADAK